jgi:hypothetical protein
MQRLSMKHLAALAVTFMVSATPAMAQATRTWVSGVGDDANPCSRTAPCKTFAGAISKTAANGEINVLDPGGYGGVTITKSITIRADNVEAGVLVSGTNAIIVNAGANGRVRLMGLDIEGLTTGLSGINIISAFDVLIQDCDIHGFQNTGNAANGNGVLVNTTTTSRVTLRNTTLHSNNYGLKVVSAGGTGHAKVIDSLVLDNLTAGLSVSGSGNDIFIVNNQVFGPVGLEILNSGVIKSFGGNLLTSGVPPNQTGPLQ